MPSILNHNPHDEAEELLPWYATGQLDEADRVRVEDHLASCSDCREQLTLERRIVQEFRTTDPETDAGWTRLRSRIEAQLDGLRQEPRATGGVWKKFRPPPAATLPPPQGRFPLPSARVPLSPSP